MSGSLVAPAVRRSVGTHVALNSPAALRTGMPNVNLDEETIERLDGLRVEDESYDEIVNELINIYQAEEMTLQYGGDHVP